MKKLLALALSAALALGALSGCGAKQAEIALVTDTGSIDDGSFNQGAWEGVVTYSEEKAISRQSFQPSEQSTEAYVQTIERAVERGAKVVVCPGYLFADAVVQAAQAHTDVAFIAVDCQLPDGAPANAVGLVYAEEQAGFLAGYAAVKEGMTSLGFLGGEASASVVRYGYGFVQGAEYAANQMGLADGAVLVRYGYTGSFEPSPEVKDRVAAWYNAGAQAVFACGGAMGESVIEAAEEYGTKVIGVDVDQSALSDAVIFSATKSLSTSVYDMIASFYDETFPGGQNVRMDASNSGVALTMDTARLGKLTQKEYDTLYAQLASNAGDIAANIVATPAEGGSVAATGMQLVKVIVDETA